jgi:hypothetical protein
VSETTIREVATPDRSRARDDRLLGWAATFFAVAVLLHNADHLRRGADAVGTDVFWVGSAAVLAEVAVVVVVFLRHATAPLAAVAIGAPLAAGYVLVHVTPERGWLSDSFVNGDVSALSWAVALLEIAAAVTLGMVGAAVLRRRGLADAAQPPPIPGRSLGEVLAHPVVAAMVVGNVVIFAASVADL